jgi:hypothetical protein
VNDAFPRWPFFVSGLVAAVSGSVFLALGVDLDWAVIGNTAFSGLLLAWVLLRHPAPSQPQPEDVDEEFVRRLEALVSRMRRELDARRDGAAG